jgi:hypothetical protein
MSSVVGGGAHSDYDAVARLVGLVKTLQPAGLDPEGLEARLRSEIAARHSFVQSSSDVTAWTRL